MSEGPPATVEQQEALLALGAEANQLLALLSGQAVVYRLPAEREPGIGIVQLQPSRLRSGIVEVRDPGSGLRTLARFREHSFKLAQSFGLREVELFGAEVVNSKLAELLRRQGFIERVDNCPDELGDVTMTILARVYPVPEASE